MLRGSDAKRGYMRWWHSFQGICPTTQETRTFFVEYSILNPALGTSQPILGQHPYYKRHGLKPSYLSTAKTGSVVQLISPMRLQDIALL